MCFTSEQRPPAPPQTSEIGDHGPLELTAADGNRFSAYEAVPVTPRGASLVLLPDIRGLHAFYTDLALCFAQAGVDTVALDPYGRTAGLGVRDDDFDVTRHAKALTPQNVLADAHAAVSRLKERTLKALDLVQLSGLGERQVDQLSGGQRQRVAFAAAMVLEPELVVADEPVSMLDVSLRAGILRLMLDLRERRGFACLFITHDLSLAWVVADRIAVMYLGRIVETGSADEVIRAPRHPYTRALVSVIPVPDPAAVTEQLVLEGETPAPDRIPAGCRFHPRCWLRSRLGDPERCLTEDPSLVAPESAPDHAVACHFASVDPVPPITSQEEPAP